MNDLIIAGSKTAPSIGFTSNGKLALKGSSVVDFPETYYSPLIHWVEEYCTEPAPSTEVDMNISFSTVDNDRYIIELLKKLLDLRNHGKQVLVNWNYDEKDTEMKDMGQYLALQLGDDIHLVPCQRLLMAETE
jgi:hypothetical protein